MRAKQVLGPTYVREGFCYVQAHVIVEGAKSNIYVKQSCLYFGFHTAITVLEFVLYRSACLNDNQGVVLLTTKLPGKDPTDWLFRNYLSC